MSRVFINGRLNSTTTVMINIPSKFRLHVRLQECNGDEVWKAKAGAKVRKLVVLDGNTIFRSEKVRDELISDGNDIELVSRSVAIINQLKIERDAGQVFNGWKERKIYFAPK